MITKDGRTIPLRAVGRRYVEQLLDHYPVPDPPIYTVTLPGGGEETHAHDPTTLSTVEERAAWQAYEEARGQALTERWSHLTEFLIMECVDLTPPPSGEWAMDFARWGLTPPDAADLVRFKIFWVENELLPDPDDQAALVTGLYRLAGVIDEGRVTAFERFFRSTLARLLAG